MEKLKNLQDYDTPVPCVVCGCVGNGECDRPEPLDKEMFCALDRAGVCGCCNKLGRHCEGCIVEETKNA